MAQKKERAIFFDRDGVLIEDGHLIKNLDEVVLMDSIGQVIFEFRELGFKIFMVTNQTVVSRGILSLDDTLELNSQILDKIIKTNIGATFDDIELCPHHPNASVQEFREDCLCRKPRPGMILNLEKKYNIDLNRSYMIGDRASDIIAANLAGVKSIQITSGRHEEKLIECSLEIHEESLRRPDYSCQNLLEILELIKNRDFLEQGAASL